MLLLEIVVALVALGALYGFTLLQKRNAYTRPRQRRGEGARRGRS